VTLDLNGFSIVTPLQPQSVSNVNNSLGVNFGPSAAPVTVRNGVIRGFLFPAGYSSADFNGVFRVILPPNTVLEDLNLIWDGSFTLSPSINVSYFVRLTRVNACAFTLVLGPAGGLPVGCPSLVESSLFYFIDSLLANGCVSANNATVH
jgi:hypothetical protein